MRGLSASILCCLLTCSAAFVRAEEKASAGAPERDAGSLLDRLIEKPDVDNLKELLVKSGADRFEPLRILTIETGIPEQMVGPVRKIELKEGNIFGVTAEVRSRTGPQPDPQRESKPRAAFLFNSAGKLILEAGGGLGSTGSPEEVDILNLGPEEDWFVRVMCFEKRSPLNFRTDLYRISAKPIRSLRMFTHANGNPRTWGPKEKIRHGYWSFDNNGTSSRPPFTKPGETENHGIMPRALYWDADRNRFYGAGAESLDNQPLYQVDTEWSRDFESLDRNPDQMLIFGGVREYEGWHYWEVLVPEQTEARATLRLPGLGERFSATSETHALKAGLHLVQLQVNPSRDSNSLGFELRINEEKPQKFSMPAQLSARQPDPPAVVRLIERKSKPRLLEVSLEGTETPASLTVWRP